MAVGLAVGVSIGTGVVARLAIGVGSVPFMVSTKMLRLSTLAVAVDLRKSTVVERGIQRLSPSS